MTNIKDIINPDLLEKMLDEKYITKRPHNDYPLFIYNYAPTAQFDQMWNEATLQCRGLITDDKGEILARPFPKFFNFGETAVPRFVVTGLPGQVYEKADGSLGILYHYKSKWHVATRGSFHSDQAEWATGFIQASDFADIGWPTEGYTYLTEIIYPQNRIVVDYGNRAELMLLGVLSNETGEDVTSFSDTHYCYWPFGEARRFSDSDIQDINHTVHTDAHKGEEGVVMVWPRSGGPSFRLKVKRADYVEMHRIVFGMTARKVWSAAKSDVYVEALITPAVPEEFATWVRATYSRLANETETIKAAAKKRFIMLTSDPNIKNIGEGVVNRARFAKLAKRYEHPGLLFALLDNKPIDETVWDMVYPAHEVPFDMDS